MPHASRGKADVTTDASGVSGYIGATPQGDRIAKAVFTGISRSKAGAASGRISRCTVEPGLLAAGLAHVARLAGDRPRQDTRLDIDEAVEALRALLDTQRLQSPQAFTD